MQLAQWQADFKDLLIEDSDNMNDVLIEPRAHLAIYQQHYLLHLVHALEDVYPLLVKLIGSECFKAMATVYIHAHPSGSSNIHDYGEYLPTFLKTYTPLCHLPYLEEIAIVEWLSHRLSFAAEPESFDVASLARMTPKDYSHICFNLHPAAQVMAFQYPILDILDLCHGQQEKEIDLDLPRQPLQLLLIRRKQEISIIPLSPGEFACLQAFADNASLETATTYALEKEADFNLEEKLTLWIKDQVITGMLQKT